MIKFVAFIRRVSGMDRDTFLRHWHDELPPFVEALPGIRKYQQNPSIGREPAWDGMAELWFDDAAALRTAFRSPEFAALRDREKVFIGDIEGFTAEERLVFENS